MANPGSGRVPQSSGGTPSFREVPRRDGPVITPLPGARPLSPRSPERQALDQKIVELVRRFRNGDDAAFDELAPLAGRMAYHLALRSVADSNTAEEIAQEALVRLYKHVGEIAGEGAFKTWFYRIVLNLVHDHYRRSVRQDAATTTLEEIRTLEKKSSEEPLTNLERESLRGALTQAMNSLDEKHREVFLMKEVEGLSHAEIAKTLEVPEGTVWSRLSYARRKLQEKLKRLGYSA
ncbi:MAG TPA: RNA polymerase sigma factor [Planctomycetota bacterium]|nr:RNA polymerase sigma factor [Planctomycetota bacterium]